MSTRAYGTGVVLGMALLTGAGGCSAQDLEVRLAHDSEVERATRDQLLRLVDTYDVDGWLFTREVVVDETAIPHSHPVLTVGAGDPGDDGMLLSTLVHEEFHWLEDGETLSAFRAAMEEYAELYPDAPGPGAGGARDVESTYRHLLVCDLELQALSELLGENEARAVLARMNHYEWIYERVLTDERVREVAARHGFLVDRLAGA